jgi:nitrite reductase (NADH) large subunit
LRDNCPKGLTTIDEVRAYTKASASCGQCIPIVRAILAHALGGVQAAEKPPAMCGCTTLGHDDVRRAVVERRLMSQADARHALGWKNDDGSQKSRPG